MPRKLTHISSTGRPNMVDVGAKTASARNAVAEAHVVFPPAVAASLQRDGLRSAKGPVLDTAIIGMRLTSERAFS